LMAFGQMTLRFVLGRGGEDGLVAAERALALDASLAEAHAVKARILAETDRHDEAAAEIDAALELDPESYEVNRWAGYLSYRENRFDDAVRYFEKSTALMESDLNSAAMLVSCYHTVGNPQGTLRAARETLARSEKVLAQDPNNGTVLGYSGYANAALGEAERAKERMNRALLIDPDNWNMRYNFCCVLIIFLHELDAALDLLNAVHRTNPEDDALRRLVLDAEVAFVDKAWKHYVPAAKVPALTRPVDSMTGETLSPQEVFLLSRVDGTWDVKSIIQVSPIREVDALRTLKKLRERGLIELRDPA
ncbi:MAG TPA: hypothetical protein VFO11_10655, partial [Candidatus Polarisedimenticolaceae bacterium]|nr:hypothetical protein [Candidatus Polarisedimenticolaceae bacterium]